MWFTKNKREKSESIFSFEHRAEEREYDLTINDVMSKERIRRSNLVINADFLSFNYMMTTDGIYQIEDDKRENYIRRCIRCGKIFNYLEEMEYELCPSCNKELYDGSKEPFNSFSIRNKNELERLMR